MKYKVSLDANSLYALADELDKYADEFQLKVQTFLSKLADIGISVAQVNGGEWGSHIVYSKNFETSTGDITVNMVATGDTLTSEWYASPTSKEVRTEVINALLMAEFGSGHYAIQGVDGLGGQGTLNVYGHAYDSNGWTWWTDDASYKSEDDVMVAMKDGRYKFRSRGVHPTQPLHKAVMACIEQVREVAQEVFG